MDRILQIGLLLIGIVFLIEALNLGLGSIRRPGPGFLPFYIGLALSLVVFFSLIIGFFKAKKEKSKGGEKLFGRSVFNVITVVIALVVYVFILLKAGYLLSTFLLLIFLFKAGGFRKWSFILVVTFVTLSLSYLFFGLWLNIRFPKGFLGF